MAHDQQVGFSIQFHSQMEVENSDMDEGANNEADFHFKVSKMEDEDDMEDLSSDEGEVEDFIKDYKISEEDDVISPI